MAEYGCTVSAFDPSMGMGDHNHSYGVMFYSLGLSDVNQEGAKNPLSADPLDKSTWKTRTLAAIIQELGHAQVMNKWRENQSDKQLVRKAGGQSVSNVNSLAVRLSQAGCQVADSQANSQSGILAVWQSGSLAV